MIKIAICDDNSTALENIKKILEEFFTQQNHEVGIHSFASGGSLIDSHDNEKFDVIFLDIDMPEMTGFNVAQKLRDNFCNSFIIFVTSHCEMVYESFDFRPFHFIQKNEYNEIFKQNMLGVVKKLMLHMRQNDKIILEDENKIKHVIFIRDIFYLESNRHYIKYHTSKRVSPFQIRENMRDEELKYSAYHFARIHKQFLVNMRYIKEISMSKEEIVLDIDRPFPKLPMSRKYKKEAEEKYILYLRTNP
ncbi:MAG: LytTR family DNA-binding domain-containing protein [Oscillospiraceae bacterium]|nr:LytTR family DNA-binding domain-containing protein [Oscillospiraceae bacterium]